jgi:hypothetical protein
MAGPERRARARDPIGTTRAIAVAIAVLMAADAIAIWRFGPEPAAESTPSAAVATSPTADPRPVPTKVLGIQVTPSARPHASPATTTPVEPGPARPACHNSYDPACGRFYWSPAPGRNQPLQFDLSFQPAAPRAGEPVTFIVVVRDPDARPHCCEILVDGAGPHAVVDCAPSDRYGAWTPPEPTPGTKTFRWTHTFEASGRHEVRFTATSGRTCGDPFSSRAFVEAELVVWKAAPPGD